MYHVLYELPPRVDSSSTPSSVEQQSPELTSTAGYYFHSPHPPRYPPYHYYHSPPYSAPHLYHHSPHHHPHHSAPHRYHHSPRHHLHHHIPPARAFLKFHNKWERIYELKFGGYAHKKLYGSKYLENYNLYNKIKYEASGEILESILGKNKDCGFYLKKLNIKTYDNSQINNNPIGYIIGEDMKSSFEGYFQENRAIIQDKYGIQAIQAIQAIEHIYQTTRHLHERGSWLLHFEVILASREPLQA